MVATLTSTHPETDRCPRCGDSLAIPPLEAFGVDVKAALAETGRETMAKLIAAERDNERLRARLEQIAVVCTDNMDRSCDHRMALDFVRQMANSDEQSKDPTPCK